MTPRAKAKGSPCATVSWLLTPRMTRSSLNSWPTASRSGISSRQKLHQLAQKLTMTAFSPRNWDRLTTSPAESVSIKLGAASPRSVPTSPVLVFVSDAEHDHGSFFGHNLGAPSNGVGEGKDNSRNADEADAENYPLLEEGEGLQVQHRSTSMITHQGVWG